MIKILSTYIFLIASIINNLYAQPDWVTKTPSGYINDYYIGKGTSYNSRAEAIQYALENAIGLIIKNGQITIKGTEKYNETTTEKSKNGDNISFDVVSQIAKEIIVEGSSQTVSNLREVERYSELNGNYYNAYVLVSIPKEKPIPLPSKFSPIWRSFIVPGWGQLYKGESFKGISFMVMCLGGAASGFVFNELSNDANKKALASRTQVRRDFFNNESKNYSTYSTIGFITAGVFYVWSLLDAFIVEQSDLYLYVFNDLKDNYFLSVKYNF